MVNSYNPILKFKLIVKVLTLLLVLNVSTGWGQALLQWNTFGNTGTETTEPSVFNDLNLSSSNLTLGAGITSVANGNRFGGSAWSTSLANAISGNDYIEFIVTPTAGCSVTPTSFVFGWDRSASGPSSVTLRSSADGFVSDLGTVAVPAFQSNGNSITISGITNNPGPLTFRLYGYGAGVLAAGTGGFDVAASGVNVQLNGTTSCGNTITTGAVSGAPFSLPSCTATATGTVAFTSSGTFAANTYTAQLSDAAGSFSTPTNIGTLVSNANSGNINITIPAGTASGTGYLIRVISNGPSVTGSSSSTFTIALTCSVSCTVNGAMGTGYTNGCGASPNPCNLASIYSAYGTFCGTTAVTCGTACPTSTVSTTYNLEAGCSATITAEYKARTIAGSDCSNSAMDGSDRLFITNSGGTVSAQSSTMAVSVSTCATYPALGNYTTAVSSLSVGCGNSDGTVQMIITGGAVTIGGELNRGDEILTYTVNASGSCSICPTLLPVDLLDFYGVGNGLINEVYWKVISEMNIEYYVIEKSNDGVNFTPLGLRFVKSDYNNSGVKDYSLTDETPYSDITYYRLSVRELNGAFKIYNIISIDAAAASDWKFFYYQQDLDLIVGFKNNVPKNSTINLYDLSGQLLAEKIITESQTKINTQAFAEGIYFLKIETPYKTENFKIIISK